MDQEELQGDNVSPYIIFTLLLIKDVMLIAIIVLFRKQLDGLHKRICNCFDAVEILRKSDQSLLALIKISEGECVNRHRSTKK